jgi:integrase
VLAIHCGMRMGEILGLRFSDVDLTRKTIHIRNTINFKRELQIGTKTKSGIRSISISDFVAKELLKRKELTQLEKEKAGEDYIDQDFVVCTKKGKPLSKSLCDSLWRSLVKKAGVRKIKFHGLRHSCASLLLSLSIHPKVVQELLGHSSVQITMDL